MNNKVFLLAALLLNSFLLSAQKVDTDFHIYLLMGQSNMAGRGKITAEFRNMQHEHVVMLDSNYKWVAAKHPVHFDKPKVAGVGPGLSFGITMAEAYPDVKIGLVPCAVGGTSIQKWVPGGYDKTTNTHPYDDAVQRIEEAMKYGVIKGVIWHQGEANSGGESSKTYIAKLTELIDRVRTLVGNPDLPFVAGELGDFKPHYQNINDVLKELPQKVSHTAVATSEGLKDKGDVTHFDGPSADELGKRFAAKIIELQSIQNTNTSKK